MKQQQTRLEGINQLQQVMRRLRDPDGGCPWDLKQTMQSLTPYTIEEAYEVAAAINDGDHHDIEDELGDLLFQVVFYAQLGSEQQLFDLNSIASHTSNKLIRRHPHVFGDSESQTDAEIKAQWEQIKQQERQQQGKDDSVFDGIPRNLPSLLMAQKLQKRAANVGFDWPDSQPVLAKVLEEVEEVRAEIDAEAVDQQALAEEIGDLLFAVVNLARHAQVNPDHALQQANQKFKRRFQTLEAHVKVSGKSFESHDLMQLEEYWQAAKRAEKSAHDDDTD